MLLLILLLVLLLLVLLVPLMLLVPPLVAMLLLLLLWWTLMLLPPKSLRDIPGTTKDEVDTQRRLLSPPGVPRGTSKSMLSMTSPDSAMVMNFAFSHGKRKAAVGQVRLLQLHAAAHMLSCTATMCCACGGHAKEVNAFCGSTGGVNLFAMSWSTGVAWGGTDTPSLDGRAHTDLLVECFPLKLRPDCLHG